MTPPNLPAKIVPKVTLIICMNMDSFHGYDYGEDPEGCETRHPCIFIRHIIWEDSRGNHRWLDEPTWDQCCAIQAKFPKEQPHVVWGPCKYCRARGVKS